MNDFIIDTKKYPKPRSRHHNAANVYFPLHALEKKPRYYPPIIESVDWTTVFSNGKQPTLLDIGCGWGTFLVNMAYHFPQDNILGIEIRQLLTEWINNVIQGEQLPNAYALWYSLPNGLHFLESDTIQQFFSFFPDPWVKKKHHKRRAFTDELLSECHRLATSSALFRIMTDVPEVAEYQLSMLDSHSGFTKVYVEFCGDIDTSWNPILSKITLHEYNATMWNLPLTDQELFSRKKNIPYLRACYSVIKSS